MQLPHLLAAVIIMLLMRRIKRLPSSSLSYRCACAVHCLLHISQCISSILLQGNGASAFNSTCSPNKHQDLDKLGAGLLAHWDPLLTKHADSIGECRL